MPVGRSMCLADVRERCVVLSSVMSVWLETELPEQRAPCPTSAFNFLIFGTVPSISHPENPS